MLTFVPTPIGNPQDITIRAIKLFEEAELILCEDTRETKRLLRLLESRFNLQYPNVDFISFNEHNGQDRLLEISDKLQDLKVIYASDAGMPVISDPGEILVEYCQENNIQYDVLPGANALTTAYAASGFKEGEFTFFAFLPHKGTNRREALIKALNSKTNAILYESPHRLLKLLTEIAEIDDTRELFLAKELTKKFQTYYRDSSKNLLQEFQSINIRGEWVVIIQAKDDEQKVLVYDDIINFDIPPKIKAKLLSRLTGKSIKELYNKLIEK
jgi:16S rRNA (cytidine1402-2'-O)-methyltransferase